MDREESERIRALLLDRNSSSNRVPIRRERVVLPQWQSQHRRFQGGSRYHVTRIDCGRCGAAVAVTYDLFFLGIKKHCEVICGECATVVELEETSEQGPHPSE